MNAPLPRDFARLHDSVAEPQRLGRLWSLWDMANYAWQFFLISEFVSGIRGDLRSVAPVAPHGLGGLGGLGNIFNNANSSNEWLTDEEQNKIKDVLSLINRVCRDIGIRNISSEIDRISSVLPNRKKISLVISIEHLSDRIVDELKETEFAHIDAEKVQYYKQQELFGSVVGEKFPKLIEDIASSGTCYALGQYTACVFHLMRVMEHCVQRLGKKLKVSIDTRTKSGTKL